MNNSYHTSTAQASWQQHSKAMSTVKDDNLVVHRANSSYLIQEAGGARGRPDYNRGVYEYYRPSERIPRGNSQRDLQEIMEACRLAYESVGIIKSTIDMMSEFGAEGIEIVHPDTTTQNFYRNWSKLVHLEDRAERFLSWFFKSGNTAVRRRMGKLDSTTTKRMKTALAASNDFGEIPIGYVFYNPAHINVVGDAIGAISSAKVYTMRVPLSGFLRLKTSESQFEKKVYENLPEEVKKLIGTDGASRTSQEVEIPSDKIYIAHYKKDDTDIWAKSFIYSILSDVYYNDKLKLAKTTALDGIINVIRLWKLGDHTAVPPLYPDENMTGKLAQILSNNVGGGAMDIIWNSAIELQEFYPPISDLANFKESYHGILLGLGVPETLIGGSEVKAGIGTNTIGLKNFVKRLEAGRRALKMWLETEIDIIHKAMNFKRKPQIRFAHSDLHDERTYFQMLVQLADRNIISSDRVLELINELPDIEKIRVSQEEKERESGVRPPKAGAYNQPQMEMQQQFELEKLNSRNVVMDRGKEEKQNGRPPGTKDSYQRKRGEPTVRAPASMVLHANKVFDFVDAYSTKLYLHNVGLDDVRKLTAQQKEELENAKNLLLPVIEPNTILSEDSILQAMRACSGPVKEFNDIYVDLLKSTGNLKLSQADKKILKVQAYLEAWGIN